MARVIKGSIKKLIENAKKNKTKVNAKRQPMFVEDALELVSDLSKRVSDAIDDFPRLENKLEWLNKFEETFEEWVNEGSPEYATDRQVEVIRNIEDEIDELGI